MSGTASFAARLTLPDGREIVGPNRAEALALWRELGPESPLGRVAEELGPRVTVVDVGAHVGLSSLWLASRRPQSLFVACEPAPVVHACLAENFRRHVPRSTTLQVALGSHAGRGELVYRPFLSSNSTLAVDDEDDDRSYAVFFSSSDADDTEHAAVRELHRATVRLRVRMTTLRRIFVDHDLTSVDLLKIDVERSELAVLSGVGDAMWGRVQRVLVDVHDIDGRLQQVDRLLRDLGFDVESLQDVQMVGSSVHHVVARRL